MNYLSSVDDDNKIDKKINDLIGFLHCGHLITCNHVIFALGLITQNKQQYQTKIIEEFLRIQDDRFDTGECKAVLDFIRKTTESQRNVTRKKAFQLLQRIDKINKQK
ncbi:MAG: hypothetical protein Q7J16_10985 [Candidatus Cloacimonadales bacterium]|nr:hypothetical protein [Candidatus Cloacimonadales bacterium]